MGISKLAQTYKNCFTDTRSQRALLYRRASRSRQLRVAANELLQGAPTAATNNCHVTFTVQREVAFGDVLRVVGGVPSLGSWQGLQAPKMTWNEGHRWTAEVDLPPGSVEFKFVIHRQHGQIEWETGSNRVLEADVNLASVECTFGSPAMTVQSRSVTDATDATNSLPPDAVLQRAAAGDEHSVSHAPSSNDEQATQQPADSANAALDPLVAGEQADSLDAAAQTASPSVEQATAQDITPDISSIMDILSPLSSVPPSSAESTTLTIPAKFTSTMDEALTNSDGAAVAAPEPLATASEADELFASNPEASEAFAYPPAAYPPGLTASMEEAIAVSDGAAVAAPEADAAASEPADLADVSPEAVDTVLVSWSSISGSVDDVPLAIAVPSDEGQTVPVTDGGPHLSAEGQTTPVTDGGPDEPGVLSHPIIDSEAGSVTDEIPATDLVTDAGAMAIGEVADTPAEDAAENLAEARGEPTQGQEAAGSGIVASGWSSSTDTADMPTIVVGDDGTITFSWPAASATLSQTTEDSLTAPSSSEAALAAEGVTEESDTVPVAWRSSSSLDDIQVPAELLQQAEDDTVPVAWRSSSSLDDAAVPAELLQQPEQDSVLVTQQSMGGSSGDAAAPEGEGSAVLPAAAPVAQSSLDFELEFLNPKQLMGDPVKDVEKAAPLELAAASALPGDLGAAGSSSSASVAAASGTGAGGNGVSAATAAPAIAAAKALAQEKALLEKMRAELAFLDGVMKELQATAAANGVKGVGVDRVAEEASEAVAGDGTAVSEQQASVDSVAESQEQLDVPDGVEAATVALPLRLESAEEQEAVLTSAEAAADKLIAELEPALLKQRLEAALPLSDDAAAAPHEHSNGQRAQVNGQREQMNGQHEQANGRRDQANGQLRLVAAGFMLPRVDKVATGGEDALFISSRGCGAIGVADGVSGWMEHGVNAAEYAQTLMRYAEEALLSEGDGIAVVSPRQALMYSQYCTCVAGSATTCVATLSPGGRLQVANLGDCGLRVIRDGKVILATKAQLHSFNTPFQLCHPSYDEGTDTPAKADEYSLTVQAGDIVVLATDGLFDNMYDEEIAAAVAAGATTDAGNAARSWSQSTGSQSAGSTVTVAVAQERQTSSSQLAASLARQLCVTAHEIGMDASRRTPWSESLEQKEAGDSTLLRMLPPMWRPKKLGGKPDDTAVVVAVVEGSQA